MSEISTDELRKLVTETDFPAMVKEFTDTQNPPPMPEGVPKTFMEALFYDKYCVVPVEGYKDQWRFIVIGPNGSKITDERTDEFIYYDTYEDAEKDLAGINAKLRNEQ